MNCHRIKRSGKPAGWLHSLVCAECRASQRTDDLLSFGIVQLRKPSAMLPALNRTLDTLNLPNVEDNYALRRRRQRRREVGLATASALLVGVSSWFCYMDWNPGTPLVLVLPVQAESPGYLAFALANHSMIVHTDASTTPRTDAQRPKPFEPTQFPASIDAALTKLDPAPTESGLNVAIKPLEFAPSLRSTPEAQTLGLFLQENAQALKIVRANLSTPYTQRIVRSLTDESDRYDISTVQALSRLLYADAKWKAIQGDRTGALHGALDLVEFGGNVAGGGSLIARLLGNKYQTMGQRLIWRMLAQMSAKDSRQAAREMESLMQKRSSLRTTIQWESLSGLMIRQDILRKPFWRWEFSGSFLTTSSDSQFFNHLGATATLYTTSNWRMVRDYIEYMDALDQDCAQPFSPNRPLQAKEPSNALDKILLPYYATIRFNDTECVTQNALLTTALALHAYQLEHHANPENLQALVSKTRVGWGWTSNYLSRIPNDPFRPTTSLQYSPDRQDFDGVTGLTYLLYSVGPDGADEGGLPTSGPYDGTRKLEVAPDSKGDIVAGINR